MLKSRNKMEKKKKIIPSSITQMQLPLAHGCVSLALFSMP